MAVVGILALHLTGPSRQQVLQGPKTVLYPTATLPRPYKARRTDRSLQTHHIILIDTGLLDNGDGHHPIRGTGGPQPRTAHPSTCSLARQGHSPCCCK